MNGTRDNSLTVMALLAVTARPLQNAVKDLNK